MCVCECVCEWAGWRSVGMSLGRVCDPSIWELAEAGFRSGVEEMNRWIFLAEASGCWQAELQDEVARILVGGYAWVEAG